MGLSKRCYLALTHLAIASLLPLALGCAMAWPKSQLLPPSDFLGPNRPIPEESVRLFREGETPQRAVVRIAAVAAHGNGYATRETLENTLIKEAARLGAEVVVVTQSEVTRDETVGSYGGGIMIADQIQRPHLYGVACRWATASMGINFDREDGQIRYVKAGSPAEKAGIKEGHKILAINGNFIGSDQFVIEREVLSKRPGEIVSVELLSPTGDKWVTQVTLQSP
jgi:predicted metalloprotease with PDZ domain